MPRRPPSSSATCARCRSSAICELVRCALRGRGLQGADIVTTVTADKSNAVILTPPMVRAGMHINAVGGDCPGKTELHADILRLPDARVVVEYEPQSRIEGEIQQMDASISRSPSSPTSSAARAPARRGADEITIFDSVGFALEDYSALRFLHELLARGARQPRGRSTWCRNSTIRRTCSAARSGAGMRRPRLRHDRLRRAMTSPRSH